MEVCRQCPMNSSVLEVSYLVRVECIAALWPYNDAIAY